MLTGKCKSEIFRDKLRMLTGKWKSKITRDKL